MNPTQKIKYFTCISITVEKIRPECLYFLEQIASEFYLALATKINDKRIAKSLEIVGLESKNHAEIIETFFGRPENMDQCLKMFGREGSQMLLEMKKTVEEVARREYLSREEIVRLLEKFNSLELVAGEEIYSKIYASLLEMEAKDLLKVLLKSISSQEDFHYNIVSEVLRELKK